MARMARGTQALAAMAAAWIMAAMPAGAQAPGGIRARLAAADDALAAGRTGLAREEIERAETALLNAGRGAPPRAVAALAAARGAIERGATAEARAALQP